MATRPIDNRRDILLLLLYSPGIGEAVNEPIVGRTRLMKMLFLFKQEALGHFRRGTLVTDENFYDFFPWDFGPFSRQVYDDLAFFTLHEFIEARNTNEDPFPEANAEWIEWLSGTDPAYEEEMSTDYGEVTYSLTERGKSFTATLYAGLSPAQRSLLKAFKKRFYRVPLRAILKYVYETYPHSATKSQIKAKILGHE